MTSVNLPEESIKTLSFPLPRQGKTLSGASYSMTSVNMPEESMKINEEPHPFHVKSDWDPPVQPSVALETFPEEVKFELANIKSNRLGRKTACHRESEMLSKNYRVTRTLY